jgi:hypothetical protein
MWTDFNTIFVNLDKLDCVTFEEQDNNTAVMLYFHGREEPIVMESGNLKLDQAKELFKERLFHE